MSVLNAYRKVLSMYEQLKFKMSYEHTKEAIEGPISNATIQAITNSINNRWRLYMYYIGDKETKPGYRWVEPYVWGLSKFTGNNLLRAYQYKGVTTTESPQWKTYRLDRIRNTAPLTSKTFDKPQPMYNPSGDGLMSSIILQIQFPKS